MHLQFLGTGAGVPAKVRNVSALALKLLDELNEVWLFDCGEATQHQILRTHIKPRKIRRIFITHLHGDHIYGLPGLLSSRSNQAGQDPVDLYGPEGIKDFVLTSLRISKTKLAYPLNIHELSPQGGTLDLDRGWQAEYMPLEHGILCFGYRIIEPDKVGQLLMDKLAAYEIPNGPIFGQLKAGARVTLEDGRILNGQDFLAPDQAGRIVTILGDTRSCRNILQLARGADVLVHEATHQASEAKIARAYYHSTSAQAAQNAKQAHVKKLYLNHISARYLGKQCKQLEKEAQETFSQATLVNDFDEFEVLRS